MVIAVTRQGVFYCEDVTNIKDKVVLTNATRMDLMVTHDGEDYGIQKISTHGVGDGSEFSPRQEYVEVEQKSMQFILNCSDRAIESINRFVHEGEKHGKKFTDSN